ncbi:MAG: carboxymuconolactone decarboxylase family protein [Euryarchaeota archaeon]|nr:carboxymuconolactone decarboxylase family protein [Euryarchaeota archaeon]
MEKLPKAYTKLKDEHPEIAAAHDQLGSACARAGPLDAKTQSLVKLGISIGARLEGAVHAHARRALGAGATTEELRHTALLAATTIGFPSAVATQTWIDETVAEHKGQARKT